MTDSELRDWWLELGELVLELRRAGSSAADELVDAVVIGSTSGEILCQVGVVLDKNRGDHSLLDAAGRLAWDAVAGEVNGAHPGIRVGRWLGRLDEK